jgi:glycosyltransferase involved in cell wall biosynthesis
MLGPSRVNPGGITRVVDNWEAAGLRDAVDVDFVSTTTWDVSVPRQIAEAVRAYVTLVLRLSRTTTRPDVVHIHFSTGGSLYRKLVASWIVRAFGVPYIAHLHSGGFERWQAQRRWRNRASRSLMSHAAVTAVPANRWLALAQSLAAREVVVLPNTISPHLQRSLEEARSARSSAGSADEPIVLYYGRWAANKGLDVLARALTDRVISHPYHVHLWGNGDRAWLEAAFAGVSRLTIHGWLDDESKPEELRRATVFVHPSREEGFGQALLEAMCAGTPIVASDAGAIPEVLAGYPLGEIVPAGEPDALALALQRALTSTEPRQTGGLPERFEPTTVLATLCALYERVTA